MVKPRKYNLSNINQLLKSHLLRGLQALLNVSTSYRRPSAKVALGLSRCTVRRALSLTFKFTTETTTIMIELLIEILNRTPSDNLCSVAGCPPHTDCSLCPFVSDYRKEILVEELEEFVDAN